MREFRNDDHLRRIIRDFQRQNAAQISRAVREIRESGVTRQVTESIAAFQASPVTRGLLDNIATFQTSILGRELRENLANLQKTILPDLQRRINEVNTAQFRALYAGVAEAARIARERTFPSNWSGLSHEEIEAVVALMNETGLSLVWVPREEIVRELLAADAEGLEEVLTRSSTEVVKDLEAALADVGVPELIDLRDHLLDAAAAFRAGFHAPAQALATATFTTILHVHLGLKRFGEARDEFGKYDPMEVTITAFKMAAIYGAAARAIDKYMGDEDEPIPTRFNRHASTHRVSQEQYTAANGLASLLLATSLLRELDLRLRLQFPDEDPDDPKIVRGG